MVKSGSECLHEAYCRALVWHDNCFKTWGSLSMEPGGLSRAYAAQFRPGARRAKFSNIYFRGTVVKSWGLSSWRLLQENDRDRRWEPFLLLSITVQVVSLVFERSGVRWVVLDKSQQFEPPLCSLTAFEFLRQNSSSFLTPSKTLPARLLLKDIVRLRLDVLRSTFPKHCLSCMTWDFLDCPPPKKKAHVHRTSAFTIWGVEVSKGRSEPIGPIGLITLDTLDVWFWCPSFLLVHSQYVKMNCSCLFVFFLILIHLFEKFSLAKRRRDG